MTSRNGSSSRSGQGAAKAVRVLGEKAAVQAAETLDCPIGALRCQKGKDGRWYRVEVPEGVAVAFDYSKVSVRADSPDGIVQKLLQHPSRLTAPASG